jgi:protein-S-isoprenylcysteine O-methyltransferase Ste14
MVEPLVVTFFPALFLIVLFGGGELFRRKSIDMDGDPPIGRRIFYISKYSILLVWGAAVLHSWGVNLAILKIPETIHWIAAIIWMVGFTLLLLGRFGMGNSFRIGSPRENTDLVISGLFRFSRNPMYLGVYATLTGAILYTQNPAVFVIGIFIIAVHHRIVLAEEDFMRKMFGQAYSDYCCRVRRYL